MESFKRNLPKGEIKTILNDYENEIISIRNKFAHAVLETDKNGRAFFKHKEDGLDFNEDFCKVIRENIIKHKTNLDNLKATLVNKPTQVQAHLKFARTSQI